MDFCENSLITLTTGQEVMEFIGVYVYSEVFTTLCRAIDFFFITANKRIISHAF